MLIHSDLRSHSPSWGGADAELVRVHQGMGILKIKRNFADITKVPNLEIPWTKEPGGPESTHRVARIRYDLATKPPGISCVLCCA